MLEVYSVAKKRYSLLRAYLGAQKFHIWPNLKPLIREDYVGFEGGEEARGKRSTVLLSMSGR